MAAKKTSIYNSGNGRAYRAFNNRPGGWIMLFSTNSREIKPFALRRKYDPTPFSLAPSAVALLLPKPKHTGNGVNQKHATQGDNDIVKDGNDSPSWRKEKARHAPTTEPGRLDCRTVTGKSLTTEVAEDNEDAADFRIELTLCGGEAMSGDSDVNEEL